MRVLVMDLGELEVSPEARAALEAHRVSLEGLLARHTRGDSGDQPEDVGEASSIAYHAGGQVDSKYSLSDKIAVLISTGWDRQTTRVLLESEYELEEIEVRAGYDLWACSYDHEMNPLIAVEEPMVKALLQELPHDTIVDLGAGTGRHSLTLARSGARVTAIDLSRGMLQVAQQKAMQEEAPVSFVQSSLLDGLPFDDRSFDLAICALTLCHLPSIPIVISEIRRLLNPGGHLLVTDLHPEFVEGGGRTEFYRPGITFLLPNRPHTRADYIDSMKRSGFDILEAHDIPFSHVPNGVVPSMVIERCGERPFCLVILAKRS